MRGKIVISLTRRYETDLLAHIDLDRPVEVRVIRVRSYKRTAHARFLAFVAMAQVLQSIPSYAAW